MKKTKRQKIAVKMAHMDKVYECFDEPDFTEVRGTTGGDMRCIRVYFNPDDTVKYVVER